MAGAQAAALGAAPVADLRRAAAATAAPAAAMMAAAWPRHALPAHRAGVPSPAVPTARVSAPALGTHWVRCCARAPPWAVDRRAARSATSATRHGSALLVGAPCGTVCAARPAPPRGRRRGAPAIVGDRRRRARAKALHAAVCGHLGGRTCGDRASRRVGMVGDHSGGRRGRMRDAAAVRPAATAAATACGIQCAARAAPRRPRACDHRACVRRTRVADARAPRPPGAPWARHAAAARAWVQSACVPWLRSRAEPADRTGHVT